LCCGGNWIGERQTANGGRFSDRGLELIGIAPIDWLGDPKWAMQAIILLAVWKNFGYTMIIFVAALQGIPEELYEAARIDGANALQQSGT
jgi:multiple sugar transport system permease protein